MEDRVPNPPLAGVPVHAAELRVWPHARQVESLCAGFLARHDSRHGDVCLSRLAGQCRSRPSPAYDWRMGIIRRWPAGDDRGNDFVTRMARKALEKKISSSETRHNSQSL